MTSGELALLGALVAFLVLIKPFILLRRRLKQDAKQKRLRRKAFLRSLDSGQLQKAKKEADQGTLDLRKALEEEEEPNDG